MLPFLETPTLVEKISSTLGLSFYYRRKMKARLSKSKIQIWKFMGLA